MSGFLQGRLVRAGVPYAASHATGGGLPSALAGSAGSQPHTAQVWRNAERAKSSASACGLGLERISSQSRIFVLLAF